MVLEGGITVSVIVTEMAAVTEGEPKLCIVVVNPREHYMTQT